MSSNFVNFFNQVNIMVRFANMQNSRSNNTASNLQNSQNSIFNQQGVSTSFKLPQLNLTAQQSANLQQENIINEQLQESILQTQEALKEFTQEDKSALVKAMLDMPEDMAELLKLIANNKNNLTNADFMKLLSSLNSNGKDAMAKLSKLLVIFGSNNLKGTKELQELYTIINAYTSGNVQNASQLMKNMILLYLPWLPLGENNNFDLKLQGNSGGGDGSDGDDEPDSIVIQIQTVNYSNVSVTLSQKKNSSDINMFIECSEKFPKAKLHEMVMSEAKSQNINTEMSFGQNKSDSSNKNENMTYNMNVSKSLSTQLIMMAQTVIKAVIEIDKHETLLEKRKIGVEKPKK